MHRSRFDDEVGQQRYPEKMAGGNKPSGDGEVGMTRSSRCGMIVGEDDPSRPHSDRIPEHLAWAYPDAVRRTGRRQQRPADARIKDGPSERQLDRKGAGHGPALGDDIIAKITP